MLLLRRLKLLIAYLVRLRQRLVARLLHLVAFSSFCALVALIFLLTVVPFSAFDVAIFAVVAFVVGVVVPVVGEVVAFGDVLQVIFAVDSGVGGRASDASGYGTNGASGRCVTGVTKWSVSGGFLWKAAGGLTAGCFAARWRCTSGWFPSSTYYAGQRQGAVQVAAAEDNEARRLR